MSLLRALQRSSASLVWQRRGYAAASSPATAQAAAPGDSPSSPGEQQQANKGSSQVLPPPPKSACESGTVLMGVNYLKNQPPVVALPDDQYPDWLWTILSPKIWPDDGPGGKAERVKRRQENRRKIKDRNFMQTQ